MVFRVQHALRNELPLPTAFAVPFNAVVIMIQRFSSCIFFLLFFLSIPCARGMNPSPDHPPVAAADVFNQPWGFAGQYWPDQVFYELSDFYASYHANESRQVADGAEAAGHTPILGAVAWMDTYLEGLPGGAALSDASWVAFSHWFKTRDNLISTGPRGNYWFYTLGWVAPMMPLDPADWPTGVKHATFADWEAERLGQLSAVAHTRGLYAADLVVGMPNAFANGADFHPREVEAFERKLGFVIPGETASEKSRFILGHLMSEWLDYCCDGYGWFYTSLGRKIRQYTSKEPLVGGQIYADPSLNRWLGIDMRRFRRLQEPANWYFDVEMQGDPLRTMPPPNGTVARIGTACAWEPDMLLGSKMNVKDSSFTGSLALGHEPEAYGDAILRSHWFQIVFAHIAGRDGVVRRGVAALEYGYGATQTGDIDPAIPALMNAHIPRVPFGPAFFYSEAMMRSYEREGNDWQVAADAEGALQTVGCGYFVTEVALDRLAARARPTCWIVTQPTRLPTVERQKLAAIAPVCSPAEAAALSPVQTSANANGWGFIDQNGVLVLLIANLAPTENNVLVTLSSLIDGTYALHDEVANNTAVTLKVTGGVCRFPLDILRGDTRLLSLPAAAVTNH